MYPRQGPGVLFYPFSEYLEISVDFEVSQTSLSHISGRDVRKSMGYGLRFINLRGLSTSSGTIEDFY